MPKVVREYKDQARARIIGAAVQVLQQKGLRGVTMDDIAREIGVSKGALYLYFPSKAQLLEAILSRFREEMMAGLERAVEVRDVAEAIAGTIDKIFSGEFNPSVWHQVIADAAGDPDILDALREDSRRDAEDLQEFLRRMVDQRRIPPLRNPEVVADIIYFALGGTIFAMTTRKNPEESRRRLIRALRWALGLPLDGVGTPTRIPSRSRRARVPDPGGQIGARSGHLARTVGGRSGPVPPAAPG